jgi:DNA-binding MarR family transcriptional regulator
MAIIIKATNEAGRRKLIRARTLDEIVNYLVYRSARILRYKFQKDMRAVGLNMTQEQYFILFKLWQKDGPYQAELEDGLLGDSPNITRILDGMEQKKMIERRSDPRDRRKLRIHLADEGRRIRRLYLKHAPRARLEDYSGLDDKDLSELKRILNRIESNIMGRDNEII